jgi:hypothetical protein
MAALATFATLTAPILLLGAPAAHAAGARDSAMAEALFQDGKTLLAQGRTSDACNKFAASQRIDPQVGTLLFLATCHEDEGKTASAWAEFNAALASLDRAPDPKRETYARAHRERLSTRLSRLILSTAAPAPGLEVWVDDGALDAGGLGTPLPVDPGVHTIRATAPLRREWSTTVRVADGPIDVALTVPQLDVLAPDRQRASSGDDSTPATALIPAPSTGVAATSAPAAATASDPSSSAANPGPGRTLAYAAGAAGVAGLVVGSVAGIWAIADKSHADHGSCSGTLCTQHGLDLYSEAATAGWVSTAGFSLAAVGLGVGAAAWILSEPPKSGATAVHGAGVSVAGVW